MALVFARERLFPDLFGEMRTLLERHWNEVAVKEISGPLDINEDAYRALDAGGHLILVTAREDGLKRAQDVPVPRSAADAKTALFARRSECRPGRPAERHGELIGYAAYILAPNLHYRSRAVAEADVFYLAPEYRKGLAGLRLLQAAERECVKAGARVIQNKVKVAHDCGRIFERLGYTLAEKLYVKAATERHAPEERR